MSAARGDERAAGGGSAARRPVEAGAHRVRNDLHVGLGDDDAVLAEHDAAVGVRDAGDGGVDRPGGTGLRGGALVRREGELGVEPGALHRGQRARDPEGAGRAEERRGGAGDLAAPVDRREDPVHDALRGLAGGGVVGHLPDVLARGGGAGGHGRRADARHAGLARGAAVAAGAAVVDVAAEVRGARGGRGEAAAGHADRTAAAGDAAAAAVGVVVLQVAAGDAAERQAALAVGLRLPRGAVPHAVRLARADTVAADGAHGAGVGAGGVGGGAGVGGADGHPHVRGAGDEVGAGDEGDGEGADGLHGVSSVRNQPRVEEAVTATRQPTLRKAVNLVSSHLSKGRRKVRISSPCRHDELVRTGVRHKRLSRPVRVHPKVERLVTINRNGTGLQ